MTENIFSLLRTPLHVVAFSNSSLIPITDKQFIALGFGGLVNGRVRHCFPLNGNPRQPQCRGIEGVVQAYYHSLQNGEAARRAKIYINLCLKVRLNLAPTAKRGIYQGAQSGPKWSGNLLQINFPKIFSIGPI